VQLIGLEPRAAPVRDPRYRADGAVVLGRWRLTETPNAGSGVFSVVLERRPEGWRIIHDHTSADP
jgi:ketosteroid isomerase-like protein